MKILTQVPRSKPCSTSLLHKKQHIGPSFSHVFTRKIYSLTFKRHIYQTVTPHPIFTTSTKNPTPGTLYKLTSLALQGDNQTPTIAIKHCTTTNKHISKYKPSNTTPNNQHPPTSAKCQIQILTVIDRPRLSLHHRHRQIALNTRWTRGRIKSTQETSVGDYEMNNMKL